MRPMSLYESGESSGEVSLKSLFENKENISGINKLNLQDIAFLSCRGGWPRALLWKKILLLSRPLTTMTE